MVFANSAPALRFYLRLGFEPIETSGIGMRLERRDHVPAGSEGVMCWGLR